MQTELQCVLLFLCLYLKVCLYIFSACLDVRHSGLISSIKPNKTTWRPALTTSRADTQEQRSRSQLKLVQVFLSGLQVQLLAAVTGYDLDTTLPPTGPRPPTQTDPAGGPQSAKPPSATFFHFKETSLGFSVSYITGLNDGEATTGGGEEGGGVTHTQRKKTNRVWRTHPQKPSAGAGPKTTVWQTFDLCFGSQRCIFPLTAVCHSDISVCKCSVLDLFRHSNHVTFDTWSERGSRATSEKQQRVEK